MESFAGHATNGHAPAPAPAAAHAHAPLKEEEKAKIIPWRAQLRKTNSKLNLLE